MIQPEVDFAKRTLLIVDDDDDLREVTSDRIAKMGYRVITASDVGAARQLLDAEKPHAILCDIVMPEASGVDFLREIRSQGNDVPFVFFTGFDERIYLLDAVRLGATNFLNKPFEDEEFAAVIARTLEVGVRRQRIHATIANLRTKMKENGAEFDQLELDLRFIAGLGTSNTRSRS